MALQIIAAATERAVSIANGVWSLVRSVRKRDSAESQDGQLLRKGLRPLEPLDIELAPIAFEIGLRDRVPQIEVLLLAINYLPKSFELREATVNCHIGSSPTFEKLDLVTELDIPARRSRHVTCRRPLVESEITHLKATYDGTGPLDAGIQYTAVGRALRKDIRARSTIWLAVRGWISGLPQAKQRGTEQ